MIRSELVRKLADNSSGLALKDIDHIVSVFFDTISAALEKNDRVEIRGFGTFSTRSRDARQGRNPRTGASVAIDTKRVPHFKAGKALNARLNEQVFA